MYSLPSNPLNNRASIEPWALFIDIEGFSNLLISDRGQAAFLVRVLANGIHNIGSRVFPEVSERLFAYGLGDGFLIVPDISRQTVEKPLAIATVLMHHILSQGGVAKASISRGETADVSGWFTDSVREGSMGHGLIRIYHIMGTALLNSYNVGKDCSGAVLALDPSFASELPEAIIIKQGNPILVDWINIDFPLLQTVANRSALPLLPASEARVLLSTYIENQSNLTEDWINNTNESTTLEGV